MNDAPAFSGTAPAKTENFDVLIVGAGISGIGGAYHLTKQCPETRFVVLESQTSFGGTWLTHRYPGIRSDSDLHTFGYRFKPWRGAPIATAAQIMSYMGEVIDENDLDRHIRYRHQIASASWSSNGQPLDDRGGSRRHRRDGAFHRELPVDVPGLLPAFRGLHAALGRHGEVQGSDRASADLAGGSGLSRQEGRGDRLRRHRGDAHPRDRSRVRPRHDAAALADLFQGRPQCRRAGRAAAGTADRRDVDPRNRAPQDPA